MISNVYVVKTIISPAMKINSTHSSVDGEVCEEATNHFGSSRFYF